jgi:hypothetical protein
LLNRAIRVGATHAAGHGTHGTDDIAQAVNHGAIPVVRIVGIGLDDARIAGLQVLDAGRLNVHNGAWRASFAVGMEGRFGERVCHLDDYGSLWNRMGDWVGGKKEKDDLF